MKNWIAGRCPSGKLLTAYIEGSLSPEQRHRVEDHLLSCPLCDSAVTAYTEHGLPSQASPSTKTSHLTKTKTFAYWPQLAAAAIALLLLFAGWHYFEDTRNERLFASYFDPQPLFGYNQQRVVTEGERSHEADLLEQALNYHREAKFPEANMAWRAYFEVTPLPEDWRPQLYAANAALAMNQPEEAAFYLDQLPARLNGSQGEQLLWYRALYQLKAGNLTAASARLETLMQQGQTRYATEWAPQLLEQL